jgi:hypothetical protein
MGTVPIYASPESRSNWLAHNLVERAALRFGLPTAHIVAERAGHLQPPAAAAA